MQAKKTDSIATWLDNWPPFLVYALARHSTNNFSFELTVDDITAKSGLSRRTVLRLCNQLSWSKTKLCVIEAFCKGCNFNFFDTGRHATYIKRNSHNGNLKFFHSSSVRWKTFVRICDAMQKKKAKKTQ